ncbi:MAG: DUF5305 domain-containing protein [Candidatus Saccharibacteria bacterium]|nr:DUF5305 domain-containing protein [Candidatus Saccharibacteria bacterium]
MKKKEINENNIKISDLRRKTHIYCLVLCVLLAIFGGLLVKSLMTKQTQSVDISESGKIDYTVALRPNNFYDNINISSSENDKVTSFISNLIKNIDLDINYKIDASKSANGKIDYEVYGLLNIVNSDTDELFYNKRFELSGPTSIKLEDGKNIIKKSISINYAEYDKIAKQFADFKVNADSELKVIVDIKKDISSSNYSLDGINSAQKLAISIPLNINAVTLDMKDANFRNSFTIGRNDLFNNETMAFFVPSFIVLAIAIIFAIEIALKVHAISKITSGYDKTLKRIMKEYDRLIVETKTAPDFSHLDQKTVTSFEELLDARDSIHRPINFYEKSAHTMAYFYIRVDKIVYIYKLSENSINA